MGTLGKLTFLYRNLSCYILKCLTHLVPGIGPGKTNMGETLRRQEDLHFPEVRQERVPPSGCNFLPTSEAWQLSSGKIKEGCVWPAETFGQYGEGHEEM